MNANRALAATAVAASAVGMVVQIASHVHYPTVPPGLIIMIVAATITAALRYRWAPLAAVVAGAFTVIGGLGVADWRHRLAGTGNLGAVTGTWIQVVGGVVALLAGLAALRVSNRASAASRRVLTSTAR